MTASPVSFTPIVRRSVDAISFLSRSLSTLFALLALSMWFAAYAWTHSRRRSNSGVRLCSDGAGGVVISLVVGGGLMALVFL